MPNLSDHDIKQMNEIWRSAQSEAVVRSLLMRTLEDLRVARDRLNQNSSNGARPPGSMAPWQGGDKEAASDDDLLGGLNAKDSADTSIRPAEPANRRANTSAPEETTLETGDTAKDTNQSTRRRAGRAVGDLGHGRTQKLSPTNFVHKYPRIAWHANINSLKMTWPKLGRRGTHWSCPL